MAQRDKEFEALQLRVPAKINLALDILGRREDGYHEVETVMQAVSIFDELTLRKREERGITLSTSLPFLPLDGRNLAYRAANAFFETVGMADYGVEITVKKRIPVGAGMGGGSADAAGVLLGLNRLYQTGFTFDALCEIGRTLGSDVPFCLLSGGAAFCSGVGDQMREIPSMPPCTLVIAKPKASLSTALVYQRYDEGERERASYCKALLRAMGGDLARVAAACGNALEEVAVGMVPIIQTLCDKLVQRGAISAAMTGSGSAVFGVFAHNSMAKQAALALRKEHPGFFVSLASPVAKRVGAPESHG
ncbi:MAG: 4-(cytidine 5'-diphospho)-2-C-methyl-D-erythritol kinase [Clostridia bacterium]|nr:4-(cytidine 5'-diphospho)-2-C-methyl-D-erythritol kinase [Clostridia bacterium]